VKINSKKYNFKKVHVELTSPLIIPQLSVNRSVNTTFRDQNEYTPCPREKQATLIFDITSPSVEIFLQFLKHLVQE